jgi:hypothetical protein
MSQLSLIPSVEEERQRRLSIFEKLPGNGISRIVDTTRVHELKIYRGGNGIWYDKDSTGSLVAESPGVTVSVLHTGSSYPPNYLFADGIMYPYPLMSSPFSLRGKISLEATKTAGRLGLPVFTVAYTKRNSSKRLVSIGWVEGWDDALSRFLIAFGYDQPPQLIHEVPFDSVPFSWRGATRKELRESVALRSGESRFHFQVMRRYGGVCCLCDLLIQEMLAPVHIRPRDEGGSDDPRNGLLLCPLHSASFKQGLIGIEPETSKIRHIELGPTLEDLKITKISLSAAALQPHPEALRWHWRRWSLLHR